MKNKILCLLLLSVAVVMPGSALATVSSNEAVKILEQSGLTRQVLDYPKMFNAALKQAAVDEGPLPAELTALFPAAVKQTIVPSEILLEVASLIIRNMNAEELQELDDWYNSNLGKTVIAAEYEAYSTDNSEFVRDNLDNLLNESQRADFADHIEKLYGSTQMLMQTKEEILVATLSSLEVYQNPGDPLDQDQIRSEVRRDLNKTRARVRKQVVASMVHTYRDIGARDLIKFEMFLGSNAAQKFYKLVNRGLRTGVEKGFAKWIRVIVRNLKQT